MPSLLAMAAWLCTCCVPLTGLALFAPLAPPRPQYMNLYELFHARAAMHRQVYTHK